MRDHSTVPPLPAGMEAEPSVGTAEAAARVGVSYATVLNDILKGVLPAAHRPGRGKGSYRVPEAALPAYRESKAKTTAHLRRRWGREPAPASPAPREDVVREGDRFMVRGVAYEVIRVDETGFAAIPIREEPRCSN